VGDPEATQLMLEALFDIRSKVDDTHLSLFGEDDDEETTEADT
jgi:hypothetical protein